NSQKHAKVLHRKLHLLVMVGIQMEWATIMRLWNAQITGQDQGPKRPGIFELSKMSQVVEQTLGDRAMQIVGADLSTRDRIFAAIERNRDEIARIGRELARKLGFVYPEALEEQVRESWKRFRASHAG